MNSTRVSKKTQQEDRRMTMTAIHKIKLQEFEKEYKSLPEKEALLEQLRTKYKISRNNAELFYLKKEIEDLEKTVNSIKNRTEYSEYQLKAMYYLDEYKNSETNKGQLSKNYLQECLSEGLIESSSNDLLICKDCNTNRIINRREAIALCESCGTVVNYQDGELCAEFSDEIEVLSPFSYRRINHFKEWISMLLARETSSPPQEVIDKLLLELKKYKIFDKNQITQKMIREHLKKLGYNKMYEHIPLIIHKICGTTPPKISKELENRLIKRFEEIQVPFEKHKPPERKNFLSYSYCIYKFLELEEQDQLLKNLSLLKSREKLHIQDKLFEKICKELGWKFISSV
jgi:hypothetical protein